MEQRRLNQNPKQNANKTQTSSMFRSNPVMNGLTKITDRASVDDSASTYGGIAVKTTYFLLTTIIGMFIYLIVNNLVFIKNMSDALSINYKGFVFKITPTECFAILGVTILGVVCQLLACFIAKTIPVTGTIYTLTQGFFIAFTIFKILNGYEYLGLLALILTVMVVFSMNLLYSKQIIKVNRKFHMVMLTLFASVVGTSLLMLICSFIPFTRTMVAAAMANPVISIGFTLISIVIASLFLISDFAMIDAVVTQRYPKKYEWRASFGLAFTVIWLYVKILDLLIQIMGKGKN